MPPPVRRDARPAEPEEVLFEVPDTTTSEAEKKYRKPNGRIEIQCGLCQVPVQMFVNDPDLITPAERQEKFLERGGSYDPPRCTFCQRNENPPKKRK